MQTSPNRPSSITRKTRLTSIIRLTRPTSLNRMTRITSTTRKTRLTRQTRLGRMTSYKGRIDLTVWTGWIPILVRIIIAELIIPRCLLFMEILLLVLFSGMAISHGWVRMTRLPMMTG